MAKLASPPPDVAAALRQASLAHASAVLRVEVTGDVGYLFVREGELVHATTLDLEGEPAVTAMLDWQDATLAWCERRWPARRSVQRSWTELRALPSAAPAAAEAEIEAVAPEPAPPAPELHLPSSFGLRQVLSRPDFKNALRLGRDGAVADSRGSTAQLRPMLRASLALGDSFGAALGLGPLLAAEAAAPGSYRLVARSAEETAAAETAGGSGLAVARAFLKL